MSIKVDLDQLSAALADRAFAYLVTVSDDYRAHTVAVHPELVEGRLGIDSVGKSTRRNASSHADVTLVWPPRELGGYTLIVDGLATVAGGALTVEPTGAVLHRPATPASPTGAALRRGDTPASPSGSGCGDDCIPLS
ncbi:MAG: pyridoxamine 5'-phosphate oxidase family protein [Mycobacterium sp.]